MARCGCASQACTCKVQGSSSIEVTGVGTASNPFTVSAIPITLTAQDTSSVDMTVTAVPGGYQISATAVTTSAGVQIFSASGTWTTPSNRQWVRVVCIAGGGGGGGGAGGRGGWGTDGGGGGGGGAGGAT